MNTNSLKLLTFICPPLAVYLTYKEMQNKIKMVFLATIFTLFFWIPGKLKKYMVLMLTDNFL